MEQPSAPRTQHGAAQRGRARARPAVAATMAGVGHVQRLSAGTRQAPPRWLAAGRSSAPSGRWVEPLGSGGCLIIFKCVYHYATRAYRHMKGFEPSFPLRYPFSGHDPRTPCREPTRHTWQAAPHGTQSHRQRRDDGAAGGIRTLTPNLGLHSQRSVYPCSTTAAFHTKDKWTVWGLGFEPRSEASKAPVLPLNDPQ